MEKQFFEGSPYRLGIYEVAFGVEVTEGIPMGNDSDFVVALAIFAE